MKNQNLDIFEYVFGCGVDAGLPRICGAGGEFTNLDKPLTAQQILNIIRRAINEDSQLDEETAERLYREAHEESAQLVRTHEKLFNAPALAARIKNALEHYGPLEDARAAETAEKLDLNWIPACQQVDQHGPVKLLRKLVDEYSIEAVSRGKGWAAEGRINIRVFKRADGLTAVTWGTGGIECTLGDLLTAIESGSEVPDWFDAEWIEYEA